MFEQIFNLFMYYGTNVDSGGIMVIERKTSFMSHNDQIKPRLNLNFLWYLYYIYCCTCYDIQLIAVMIYGQQLTFCGSVHLQASFYGAPSNYMYCILRFNYMVILCDGVSTTSVSDVRPRLL